MKIDSRDKTQDARHGTQDACLAPGKTRYKIPKAKRVLAGVFCQLLWLLPMLACIQSCNKGSVPAYIYIPSISVTGPNNNFGSFSSDITDAWVYQNESLQGAYQLPARFPIIASGLTEITIIAGVEADGIAATRIEYPLYNYDSLSVNLVPTATDTIRPVVTYLTSTQVAFINDFESGDIFSNMNTVKTTAFGPVFQGTYSGQMNVPDTATEVSSLSSASYAIPTTSPAVFLEMNYMTNYSFTMGLNLYSPETGLYQPYDVETLNAQTTPAWTKIYINLTPTIGQNAPDSTAVYFYVVKSNLTDQPLIYFDNIKLLYLNP